MGAVLFDSSMYIASLRRSNQAPVYLRRFSVNEAIWLSSVVLEELYAASTDDTISAVERLQRDFEKARRILTPNLNDWAQAGRVLARLAERYNYAQIGKGRLTNDALIAISAGRAGITVITANSRDFDRLAEFRPFRWRLGDVSVDQR